MLLLLNNHLTGLIPPNHRNSWKKWGLFNTRIPKNSQGKIWSLSFKDLLFVIVDFFLICWMHYFFLRYFSYCRGGFVLFWGCEYHFCLEYNTAILWIKSIRIVNGAGFSGDHFEQWMDLRSSGNHLYFLCALCMGWICVL